MLPPGTCRLSASAPRSAGKHAVRARALPGEGPAVAIVGARAASGSGDATAPTRSRKHLAGAGVHVVSGGALGIDGAAHRGALAGGGTTTVVLGSGVDIAYPARHAALFDSVLAARAAARRACSRSACSRGARTFVAAQSADRGARGCGGRRRGGRPARARCRPRGGRAKLGRIVARVAGQRRLRSPARDGRGARREPSRTSMPRSPARRAVPRLSMLDADRACSSRGDRRGRSRISIQSSAHTGLPVRAVLRALPHRSRGCRDPKKDKKKPAKKRGEAEGRAPPRASRRKAAPSRRDEGARPKKAAKAVKEIAKAPAKAEPKAAKPRRPARRHGKPTQEPRRARPRSTMTSTRARLRPSKPKKVKPGSALVVVESPAKAQHDQQVPRRELHREGVGRPRPRPAEVEDRRRPRGRHFEPVYEVIEGKKKVVARDPQGRARGRDRLPRIRPRSRRRGDRVAHRRGDQGRQHEPAARPDQRDHEEGRRPRRSRRRATIDMNKTDAQQARRILDRLVGYKISPILWNKVQRGLSAGRVQSVAVRLVCEREEEIKAFKPEEYWSVDVDVPRRRSRRRSRRGSGGGRARRPSRRPQDEADAIAAELARRRRGRRVGREEGAPQEAAGAVHHVAGCSRTPRASCGSPRSARWRSRSASTKASSSATRARPASSRTCVPTRRASPTTR